MSWDGSEDPWWTDQWVITYNLRVITHPLTMDPNFLQRLFQHTELEHTPRKPLPTGYKSGFLSSLTRGFAWGHPVVMTPSVFLVHWPLTETISVPAWSPRWAASREEARGFSGVPEGRPFKALWTVQFISKWVISIPFEPKWGPLFWLKFGPYVGGLIFKNRGQLGSRYLYMGCI